uniref:FAD dependent oxidoreductase domain-containing protein n=1 Tax=Meloidogyne floridensis TaxID=298350 RepID=A0A915NBE0_9BILA
MNNRIVICGGGLMGLSVAYNLAKRGVKELFLFERNCIGAHNSSRVNTGLFASPMFYSEPSLRSVAHKSLNIYSELAATGAFEFNKCGRVYLSSSDESETQARRLLTRLVTDPSSSFLVEAIDCPILINEESRVYAVDTDEGFIDVMAFVDAAGIDSSLVDVLGLPDADHPVRIAAHPCSFTFLSTDPLPHCQSSSQS